MVNKWMPWGKVIESPLAMDHLMIQSLIRI